MAIFNQRDLKRINKNSHLIRIEKGYTHVYMIPIPKEGYNSPEISGRDRDIAKRIRTMAIRASDITKNISDTMFECALNQDACMRTSNECGRIRSLSNELYKLAEEIGDK